MRVFVGPGGGGETSECWEHFLSHQPYRLYSELRSWEPEASFVFGHICFCQRPTLSVGALAAPGQIKKCREDLGRIGSLLAMSIFLGEVHAQCWVHVID